MTAISSMSDVINRLTGGSSGTPEILTFMKTITISGGSAGTNTVAGRAYSLWRADGWPGFGAAPGAVAIPTRATAGALAQADPTGGRQKWLLAASLFSQGTGIGTASVYDRLLHISGLDATKSTAQTVGGTMTRYATNAACVGNQIWLEIYTAIGATGTTVTASYTNQNGSAGQSTIAVDLGSATWSEASKMILLPLASGDTGVQAVATVTLAGTTATTGDFGITVAHPLFTTIVNQGTGILNFCEGFPGPVEVLTGACLAPMWVCTALALAPFQLMGQLVMVEK